MAILQTGDRPPHVLGGTFAGDFFALETYVGKTLVLITGHETAPDLLKTWLHTFSDATDALAELQAEPLVLISMSHPAFGIWMAEPPQHTVAALPNFDLTPFGGRAEAPDVLVLDRAGRIAEAIRVTDAAQALDTALATARRVAAPPSTRRLSAAPILIVPNLISQDLARELIDAFESGPNFEGGMASIDDKGQPIMKIQPEKKHRRDLYLMPEDPLYAPVLEAISRRLVPEIKRAYQINIAHADRILIARYDDTGGYFNRHRDNVAPQVAFRQFAVSLNLNTGEYEGGDLEFPEFDYDAYSPPAGGAVVFSASLLHAAKPVTKGRRYVLLTFLHDAQAEVQRLTIPGAA